MSFSTWILQPLCRLLKHRCAEVRFIGMSNWVVGCLRCGLIIDKHPPERDRFYCDPNILDYVNSVIVTKEITDGSAAKR